MGLPRSTFYEVPATPAEEAEIVARMGAICEYVRTFTALVASAPRGATKGSSSTASACAG